MLEFRTSRSGRECGMTTLASLGAAGDMGGAPAIATRAVATTRSCVWGAGSVLTKCLNPTEWQLRCEGKGCLPGCSQQPCAGAWDARLSGSCGQQKQLPQTNVPSSRKARPLFVATRWIQRDHQ